MTESHKRVQISEIEIGDRFRQDFGDITSLVESIKELGLLQPIGVTEDNKLVFGERRLRAAQELGWSEIDVRVVDVPSIVQGEFAENDVRKDFTPSERAAIADAVAAELGERRGRPSDNRDNCPTFSEAGRTSEIAAKKAGFTSYKTYERAKSVVENGTLELQEAMDKKEMSISAAASVAKLSPEEQNNVVQLPGTQRRKAVREIRNHEELKSQAQKRLIAQNERKEAKQNAELGNYTDLGQVRVFINSMDQLNALSCSGNKLFFLAFDNQKEYIRDNIESLWTLINDIKEASENGKVAI